MDVKGQLSEVIAYYGGFSEETRLERGDGRLECERTREILSRVLPPAPARIVDVGGGAGAYAAWLAELGYEVHLIDATERLVDEARRRSATLARPIASMSIGDARQLQLPDRFADAVLVMGPLYHLTVPADRLAALREAHRVVRSAGRIVVAAISRYASALDGLRRGRGVDPVFVRMRDRDLQDGIHLNDTHHPEYFTTSYFHRPEDLHREMAEAGFRDVQVLGVEGPGWVLPDFDDRWRNATLADDILAVARAVESEPSIVGASAHLLGLGTK
jgi:ubiquinone/menaquinone biosynthesis C-methylase UbiE